MIGTLTLLLVCQLVGEVTVRLAALPVPGPVVGLVLLFAILAARGGAPESVETTCGRFLAHLGLLFVPAGVGVIRHLDRMGEHWAALAITLVASTLAALAVTAWVLNRCLRRVGD